FGAGIALPPDADGGLDPIRIGIATKIKVAVPVGAAVRVARHAEVSAGFQFLVKGRPKPGEKFSPSGAGDVNGADRAHAGVAALDLDSPRPFVHRNHPSEYTMPALTDWYKYVNRFFSPHDDRMSEGEYASFKTLPRHRRRLILAERKRRRVWTSANPDP